MFTDYRGQLQPLVTQSSLVNTQPRNDMFRPHYGESLPKTHQWIDIPTVLNSLGDHDRQGNSMNSSSLSAPVAQVCFSQRIIRQLRARPQRVIESLENTTNTMQRKSRLVGESQTVRDAMVDCQCGYKEEEGDMVCCSRLPSSASLNQDRFSVHGVKLGSIFTAMGTLGMTMLAFLRFMRATNACCRMTINHYW